MSAKWGAVLALLLASLPLGAQVSGEGTASGDVRQAGGPDVAHTSDPSENGLFLTGSLVSFTGLHSLALQWEGIGTPSFAARGSLYRPGWVVEASLVQRAYLVGGDARFAWNPSTGELDPRVTKALQTYAVLPGTVGRFSPATLSQASNLLPQSSPGWAMRESSLTFRTLGKERGLELRLMVDEREGVIPRTFVTATGFAPASTPLTLHLPIGAPLGVVEVPERFRDRSWGFSARTFVVSGEWRLQADLLADQYRYRRLITFWRSPFPGPPILQPSTNQGSRQSFRLSAQGPALSVSIERLERRGAGEAGERRVAETRVALDSRRTVGRITWFAGADSIEREESVRLAPPLPHPVFQGPYYSLSGRRFAPAQARVYPTLELLARAGLLFPKAEISARYRRFHSPNAFSRTLETTTLVLAARPFSGLRIEVDPFLTRAFGLNRAADRLAAGDWPQSRSFRPRNGRDWQGIDASAQYWKGPFIARARFGSRDGGGAAGIQHWDFSEIFAGINLRRGPFLLRVSARVCRSALRGSLTNYARPGDVVDPADPLHRLPLAGSWIRTGQGALLDLERDLDDSGTVGFLGQWDRQNLAVGGPLDQPRDYRYAKAGIFWAKTKGPFGVRTEGGVESYRDHDPLFLSATAPPGPYLWTGMTMRPGTRGFLRLMVTWKF